MTKKQVVGGDLESTKNKQREHMLYAGSQIIGRPGLMLMKLFMMIIKLNHAINNVVIRC